MEQAERLGKWFRDKIHDMENSAGHKLSDKQIGKLIGRSQRSVNNWKWGKALPQDVSDIVCLAKLGPEVYVVMDVVEGVEPYMVSMFAQGWRMFPPDLQREYEEFFDSVTSEEVIELFRDAIKTRLSRGKRHADDDDALPDEEPDEPQK